MDYKRQTYLDTLADELKTRRKFCGFSREEVAFYAALHPNTISVIERAERDVSILSLIKVVSALGCCGLKIDQGQYHIIFADSFVEIPRQDLLSIRDSELIRRIGETVRARRESLSMTLEDIADVPGLHLNTVWNSERGLVVADGYSMYRIYQSLNVSELLEENGTLLFK